VDQVNRELARFEQIKRFRVLPEMLSVEGGGLTPTLKVKRRVVCERYAELVESMYKE
jgi:long-chain acyl-CoA synthetase